MQHPLRRTLSRPVALVWLSAVLSALLLSLSVSGTLSSWTQAVVTHNGNTISTGNGNVALKVSGPSSSSCLSTDGADNSVSCSINLFGNAGSTVGNLQPGQTASTTVVLSNEGDVVGSTLGFAPGACTGSTALCNSLQVNMVCTGAATKVVALTSMTNFGTADSNFTGTLQPLGVTTSVCIFTVSLPLTAPIGTRNQTVTQDLVWTLTA